MIGRDYKFPRDYGIIRPRDLKYIIKSGNRSMDARQMREFYADSKVRGTSVIVHRIKVSL